ncbi:DNA-binding transcriptional regulator, XRE-family HTH domain [Pilibacter termitis]|uniref:DNA-binding transcriptional regulator, XRE-family HTH domain n=1 Tax=Pilibacter termitis TaxID=263852 RepID=A0A1T4MYG7_9ENTE|nr:helix-turn-helix transcriptional regulator [Pilibacter termitis]SJZ72053.1 DNA-binding transcriptional regulator, XRE-family HTH domain [Pilibacter termitis]
MEGTLGEKLKQARERQGVSQTELARQLAVSRQTISRWETNKNLPDIENIHMLAKELGVSVDELFQEQEGTEHTEEMKACTLAEKNKKKTIFLVVLIVICISITPFVLFIPFLSIYLNRRIESMFLKKVILGAGVLCVLLTIVRLIWWLFVVTNL